MSTSDRKESSHLTKVLAKKKTNDNNYNMQKLYTGTQVTVNNNNDIKKQSKTINSPDGNAGKTKERQ